MKKVVITGASKGIGLETTRRFAEAGHTIYAIARSEDKLRELETEFPELIIPIAADLADEAKLLSLIEHHLSDTKIDILINNAGLLVNKPFLELDSSDWAKMIDVNLLGAASLIKALHPNLKGGHIVNIGSMGGFQSSSKFPGLSAYSAAKGALAILSECLSVEFLDDNITVNCLALGAVQTEMLESAFPGFQAPTNPDEMSVFIYDFAMNAHKFFNGKVLPVALQNPS